MIDIKSEQVVSLTEATKITPRRRGGKRTHVATMYRWADRGHRGVVLETIQIGGTKCTSIEALQRFFEQLTHPSDGVTNRVASKKTATNQKAIERELDAEGL